MKAIMKRKKPEGKSANNPTKRFKVDTHSIADAAIASSLYTQRNEQYITCGMNEYILQFLRRMGSSIKSNYINKV